MKRLFNILIMFSLVFITSCSSSTCKNNKEDTSNSKYFNHVSDIESENSIKGVTSDKGPQKNEFVIWIFKKLNLPD